MDVLGRKTDQHFDELELEEWLREIVHSTESEEKRGMIANSHWQEIHPNSTDSVSTAISRSGKGLGMHRQVLFKLTTDNYYSKYSTKQKKMKKCLNLF